MILMIAACRQAFPNRIVLLPEPVLYRYLKSPELE